MAADRGVGRPLRNLVARARAIARPAIGDRRPGRAHDYAHLSGEDPQAEPERRGRLHRRPRAQREGPFEAAARADVRDVPRAETGRAYRGILQWRPARL